jgi:DNA-directed RNA polymerase specialized sigma subunit
VKQIHKNFTLEQVKALFSKYATKELTRKQIQETLGIAKSRFFELNKESRLTKRKTIN